MKKLIVGAMALVVCVSTYASIVVSADPAYDTGSPVFTLDPELYSPAARNLAGTRQLRQTFQNSTTFDVGQIVLSLIVQSTASGITLEVFEVDDVNASSWAPGVSVATVNVAAGDMVSSSLRLGIALSGLDVFTLPQRDSGTEGYGIQLSVDDETTNVGAWRHSNDGTDHYTQGIYYSEGGTPPNPARDMGVNLIAVPEPATIGLMGLCGLGLFVARRYRA